MFGKQQVVVRVLLLLALLMLLPAIVPSTALAAGQSNIYLPMASAQEQEVQASAAPLIFPAGDACAFELSVDIVGGNLVYKEFEDKNGNVVRTLLAGKGYALTFTNTATAATLALKPNGSVTHTTVNPDGSTTSVSNGHNVLILFPSDVPTGPSTTLYVGKIVYTIDTNFVYTLIQATGKSTDICAALS